MGLGKDIRAHGLLMGGGGGGCRAVLKFKTGSLVLPRSVTGVPDASLLPPQRLLEYQYFRAVAVLWDYLQHPSKFIIPS